MGLIIAHSPPRENVMIKREEDKVKNSIGVFNLCDNYRVIDNHHNDMIGGML